MGLYLVGDLGLLVIVLWVRVCTVASSMSKLSVHDQDEMMNRLGLTEEDLDDVVYEMKDPPPAKTIRWLAVVRVHTEKHFSEFWFCKSMGIAWDLAKDVKFILLGKQHVHNTVHVFHEPSKTTRS